MATGWANLMALAAVAAAAAPLPVNFMENTEAPEDSGPPGRPNISASPRRINADGALGCDYPHCEKLLSRNRATVWCSGRHVGTGCWKKAHLACINRRAPGRAKKKLSQRSWVCRTCQDDEQYKGAIAERRERARQRRRKSELRNLDSSPGWNLAKGTVTGKRNGRRWRCQLSIHVRTAESEECDEEESQRVLDEFFVHPESNRHV